MPDSRPNPFKVFEAHHLLHRTSGDHEAPGVHAKNSFHYAKAPWGGVEAYDYGDSVNPRSKLVKAANDLKQRNGVYRDKQIREVFGPFPWHIINGTVFTGQFPNHGDHLHVALSN